MLLRVNMLMSIFLFIVGSKRCGKLVVNTACLLERASVDSKIQIVSHPNHNQCYHQFAMVDTAGAYWIEDEAV